MPEERGLLSSLYGGAGASAQRTVRGTPAQVLKALDDWMQRQESLVAQRYFSSERIVWEARHDVLGAVRRTMSGRGHALARTTDVAATAIALDDSRVLVRLDARLAGYRSLMAQQNVAITGAGVVVGGVLAVLSFPLLADVGNEVGKRYGVYTKKSLYGREFMGYVRTTMVVDKNGIIRKIFPKVKVNGHTAEVIAAVKELA